MPNLQIQDTFQPYYADGPAVGEKKRQDYSPAAPGLTTAEVRIRLEHCRRRLARAIAATEAGRR